MELDIYTDASIKQDKVKISSFIIDCQENEYCMCQKVKPSYISTTYNTHENDLKDDICIYEMYAIKTILASLPNKSKRSITKIRLYTDSLNTFELIYGITTVKTKKKAYPTLLNEIKQLIDKFDVEIRWIKAHVNVYGNQRADVLTRHKVKFLKVPMVTELIKKLEAA